jgi:hypothetical protein
MLALESLYADAAHDRRLQVAGYTLSIATATGDTTLIRRWSTRVFSTGVGDRRRMGVAFVQHSALRDEGLRTLRGVLHDLERPAVLPRRLSERSDAHARRVSLERRRTLAALGRALIEVGENEAALDTLTRASEAWDVPIMRSVETAARAVGDTLLLAQMQSRLAIDPGSPARVRDSLTTLLSGRADFASLRADAERAFVEGVFEHARPRAIAQSAMLQTLDGGRSDLRELARAQLGVVVVMSRFCGPAVDALPDIREMAAMLSAEGITTHILFEEAAVSDELRAFVREHQLTMPVYVDPQQQGTRTLNSWGTPMFYVLDGRGAMVFDGTSDVADATRRALAVRRADGVGIGASGGR